MNWTKAQTQAIEMSRRDVLVAAAAGSGKTAALTERVIRTITREDDPVDISRLLIVTFTEKAADELKIRIRNKLEEKAEKEPDNIRIRKQLSLLPSASISTIHSFYLKLLREGFSILGLPPKLRVAEEGSTEIMKSRLLDEIIDGYYNGDKNDGFDIENADGFFETFETLRPGEKLKDVFTELYGKVTSYPEYIDFYRLCAEDNAAAAENFTESRGFKYFRDDTKRRLLRLLSALEKFHREYGFDEEYVNKYGESTEYCISSIRRALDMLDIKDYAKLREYFLQPPEYPKNKPVKGERDFKEVSKALRATHKDIFSDAAKYFAFNEEDVKMICRRSAYLCDGIYKFLSRFDKAFSEEKLRAGVVDFNDTERFSHRLLCGGNNDFAEQIKSKYDEIYVDEYQDVNRLQDEIFASISKNNRFMVGDVKQSIYSFRGSDPTVFSSYREKFKPFSDNSSDPSVIFLSENFRCGKPIIDFTNEVFRTVFGAEGKIPYTADDELKFGKVCDVKDDVPVKITVFPGGTVEDEAEYVVKQIKYLLKNGIKDDGSRIGLSDIAVICRKSATCKAVERVFSERGLSCVNTADKSFFDSPEVLLTVSLLSAVDNPLSDVPLAAAMKSPLFGFSLDELVKIRLAFPDCPLYTALCSYAERTGDEKCGAFIKKLSYLRYKSRAMPTDKFIRLFFRETPLLSSIYNRRDGGDPKDRKSNLLMLYELARRFESDSFKGLYGFISYCNEMITKGQSFKTSNDAAGKITVQTVHSSKGLEYPVCFIMGAAARFNEEYKKETAVTDKELGVGIKVKTDDAVLTGPVYRAAVIKAENDQKVDEACLLYVSLTRAKKYLYITASPSKAPVFGNTGGAGYGGCRSYLDFLAVALDGAGGSYLYEEIDPSAEEKDEARDTLPGSEDTGDEDITELKAIYDYEYPYKEAASLPKKVSVSKLYPAFLDVDDEVINGFEDEKPPELILPDYAAAEEAASAAKKGTSTHLFMQFCDFDKAEADVYAEAKRLRDGGFIRAGDAELIYYDELKAFFTSPLYKEMKAARDAGRCFCREFRFNTELDAADFTNDEQRKKALSDEKLLVQGVIDCFFENEDGTVTIVDYKTDRVGRKPEDTEEFKNRHRQQLSYYKKAAERITLLPVSSCVLYSFCLKKPVVL